MTAPRLSRAETRMAARSQTSTQRRQVTPCCSTQPFGLESVATRPCRSSEHGEALAASADASGKKAEKSARRDNGMSSAGRARTPNDCEKWRQTSLSPFAHSIGSVPKNVAIDQPKPAPSSTRAACKTMKALTDP